MLRETQASCNHKGRQPQGTALPLCSELCTTSTLMHLYNYFLATLPLLALAHVPAYFDWSARVLRSGRLALEHPRRP